MIFIYRPTVLLVDTCDALRLSDVLGGYGDPKAVGIACFRARLKNPAGLGTPGTEAPQDDAIFV